MSEDTRNALQALLPTYVERHDIAPWLIFRCEPRTERQVKEWLLRAGWEAWYPTGKKFRFASQRSLPSKTRHKRRFEVVEREIAPYAGYVFAREMVCARGLAELDELPHVLGLCRFGEHLATISDAQIEVLRLQEADGAFNIFVTEHVRTAHAQQEARRYQDPKAEGKQWSGQSKIRGRACESGCLVTFAETLGRITHVIALPKAGVGTT